jgi:hypothetical protein
MSEGAKTVVALRHRFARERDEQCAEQPRGSMRALGRASSKRHLAERVGFEPTVRLPVHMIVMPQLFRARPFGPARVPSSPDVGLGAVLARARPSACA